MGRMTVFSRGATIRVAVLLAAAVATLGGCSGESDEALTVHVGGTMRPVMEDLAKLYEKETGQKVAINSAGSGELLEQIEKKEVGDVYICHDPFLAILMKRGLGVNGWTVAHLTPVIVTPKDDLRIKDLTDAVKPEMRLVLTDFKKSTLGWLLPTIFRKAGLEVEQVKALPKLKTFRKGSQAAALIETGNGDAAMVWDAVWSLRRDKLRRVDILEKYLPTPGVDAETTATPGENKYYLMPVRVTVATLTCSDQPAATEKFAQWLASPAAAARFKQFGFTMPPKAVKEYADGAKIAE